MFFCSSVLGRCSAARRPRLEKRYINQRKLTRGMDFKARKNQNLKSGPESRSGIFLGPTKTVILQSSNNVGSPPAPPYAREKVKMRFLRGRSDFDVLNTKIKILKT